MLRALAGAAVALPDPSMSKHKGVGGYPISDDEDEPEVAPTAAKANKNTVECKQPYLDTMCDCSPFVSVSSDDDSGSLPESPTVQKGETHARNAEGE
jgi:hypothetical protein